MNKYQEAYGRLMSRAYRYANPEGVYVDLEVLGELVEKATPKKPIKDRVQDVYYLTKYTCPTCGGKFTGTISDYCYHCGQKLDWSEDEN